MLFGKFIYLFGVFVNILTMNIIKYIGINGLLSVPEIICMRTLFATLMLLPFNFKELRTIKNSNQKTIMMLLSLGILSVFDAYFWNIGIQSVPLNNAMILLFISPIITAFMAYIFLGEKITLNIKVAFAINITAVLLMYRFSADNITIGYLFIMSDFIIYGIIAILIKKLSNFSANFLVFFRFLILLPISIFIIHKIPVINIKIAILVLLVVFGYIIERTSITYAFKKIAITEIQPLRYLNIVFSSFLSYLILGETLTKWQIIGSGIIIFGNIFTNLILTKNK